MERNHHTPSRSARRRAVPLAGLLACLSLAVVPGAQAGSSAPAPIGQYIVVSGAADGATGAAARASGNGAVVMAPLPVAGSALVSATSSQAASISAGGDIVVPDTTVYVQDTSDPPHTASAAYRTSSGATAVQARGIDGTGVTVAVVDTGIDPLPDFAGRLTAGPDLTGGTTSLYDGYGHGTFVAGLIAGNGGGSTSRRGEAPGANLVAVKVAGTSGVTDVATVIKGLQWVASNAVADHINVVNLSLGMDASVSSALNPLDRAVESLWNAGLTVVVSGGNYGPVSGSIASPGDDPTVITVGAVDDLGSNSPAAAVMTGFSSTGPTYADGWWKPDLVAPGRSVLSVRAPGSTIDQTHPDAVVGTTGFVGSGTSFSAAITSGAAALVLQAHPQWTTGQVKGALLANARPGPADNPLVDGHGQLAVDRAVDSAPVNVSAPAQIPAPRLPSGFNPPAPAPGGGPTPSVPLPYAWWYSTWNPLAWTPTPAPVSGSGWRDGPDLHDWNGTGWDGAGSTTPWNGSHWNGSSWNGSAWNGSGWNGSAWNTSGWNGSGWNGSGWNGSAWNGSAWNGSGWNGSAWNGSAWNGSAWNGSGWNGSGWNGSGWNGSGWNGSGWNGSGWN